PRIAAATDDRPYLRVIVVDPEADDGGTTPTTASAVRAVVPARAGTAQVVAEAQRLLAEARAQFDRERITDAVDRDTRLIAVTAAKAGVGATVTAVQLALALQERGTQTTLVDTDPTFGDIAMRLGVVPVKHTKDTAPLSLSPATFRQLLYRGPD